MEVKLTPLKYIPFGTLQSIFDRIYHDSVVNALFLDVAPCKT